MQEGGQGYKLGMERNIGLYLDYFFLKGQFLYFKILHSFWIGFKMDTNSMNK